MTFILTVLATMIVVMAFEKNQHSSSRNNVVPLHGTTRKRHRTTKARNTLADSDMVKGFIRSLEHTSPEALETKRKDIALARRRVTDQQAQADLALAEHLVNEEVAARNRKEPGRRRANH